VSKSSKDYMYQPHYSISREPLAAHPDAMLVVIDRQSQHGQMITGDQDGQQFDPILFEARRRFQADLEQRYLIVWANAEPGARWYTIGDNLMAFKRLLGTVVQDVIDMGFEVMRVLMVDEPLQKELDQMIWEIASSYPQTFKKTMH
jgi:hypothetical protein